MKHQHTTCQNCGKSLPRGWAGGHYVAENTLCLICWTARVMTTSRMPERKTAKERAA